MTIEEFKQIKENIVLSPRYAQEEMYVVEYLDVFGSDMRDKQVISAKQLNSDKPRYIRIDQGNCQFWEVVGKIKYE